MSTENKNNEIANALSDIATAIENKCFDGEYTDVIVEVIDSLDGIASAIIYLADSMKKD